MRRGAFVALAVAVCGGAWGATGRADAPEGAPPDEHPALPTGLAPMAGTVDLTGLLDHDLFVVDGPGREMPFLQMKEVFPDGPDIRRAPDVALLARAGDQVTLPLGGARGERLQVTTAAYGALDARGIAADGVLTYADGRTQALKWMIGEQIWPAWAGATGRGASALALGRNAGGDLVTASVLDVPLSWPGAPLDHLTITSRGGLQVGVLAVGYTPSVVGDVGGGDVDGPGWYDFSLPGRLDAPLPGPPLPTNTPHGFVRVEDGHLVTPTDPPVRLRYWGTNLVSRAALPPPDSAAAFAHTLALHGFNLARLHHLDFDGDGSIVNPLRGRPGEATTVPAALDRLDRFVAALEGEGIDLDLELLTLRSWRPEEGLVGSVGVPGNHKYLGAIWPEWEAAQEAWARDLWGRVNPYTGRRYADDPHVVTVELANEDSLVNGWATGNLEKLPRVHRDELDRRWTAWLRRRYGTDGRLAAAWAGGDRGGLLTGEALAIGSVAREPSNRQRTELYPQARSADLVRFYSELQRAHEAELARFVRDDLGFHVPLICNSSLGWAQGDAASRSCDVVDVHVYWDAVAESTVFQDQPLLAEAARGRVLERVGACEAGKACIVGEVQHSWPNRYAQEAPLLWGALAARQDLDGLAWFAWRHDTMREAPDGPDGALDLEGRWNLAVQMPVAATIFRQALVPAATASFTRWWSPDGLLRDLAEPPGLWLDPLVRPWSYLTQRVRSSFASAPPPTTVPTRAGAPDEGPVRWSPADAAFVIDTPPFAAWVGRPRAAAPRPAPSLRADLEEYASVWLTAVDGGPIDAAAAWWLGAVGRCERSGTRWATGDGGPDGLLVLGRGPARMERLHGVVWLPRLGRIRAWTVDRTGAHTRSLPVLRGPDGAWGVRLDEAESPWIRVERR